MYGSFVTADPILYESRTRSVRIREVRTGTRLENFVRDTLAILVADENMTTNALIVQLHDKVLHHRGDVQNSMSFLRVTCLRYPRHKRDWLEAT